MLDWTLPEIWAINCHRCFTNVMIVFRLKSNKLDSVQSKWSPIVLTMQRFFNLKWKRLLASQCLDRRLEFMRQRRNEFTSQSIPISLTNVLRLLSLFCTLLVILTRVELLERTALDWGLFSSSCYLLRQCYIVVQTLQERYHRRFGIDFNCTLAQLLKMVAFAAFYRGRFCLSQLIFRSAWWSPSTMIGTWRDCQSCPDRIPDDGATVLERSAPHRIVLKERFYAFISSRKDGTI